MRRLGLLVSVALLLALSATATATAQGEASQPDRINWTGPVATFDSSQPTSVFDPSANRLIVRTSTRLLLFRPGLKRVRSEPNPGIVWLTVLPNGSVFGIARTYDGRTRLIEINPKTLRQENSWAEPNIADSTNMVWSRGRLWAVLERISRPSPDVLASIDPRHPGRGWRSSMKPYAGRVQMGTLGASAHRGWLTVAEYGVGSTLDLFKTTSSGKATYVTTNEVSIGVYDLSYTPNGSHLLVDAAQTEDGPTANYGAAEFKLPDLSTPSRTYVSNQPFVAGGFTPDASEVVMVGSYGDAYGYRATDPNHHTDPLTPQNSIVQGAAITFNRDATRFYLTEERDIYLPNGGNTFKFFVASYPTPRL